MPSVNARLACLELAAQNAKNSKIAVTFQDGTVKFLEAGDCVDLIMGNTDNIAGFEGGTRNGRLPELLNGLLEK